MEPGRAKFSTPLKTLGGASPATRVGPEGSPRLCASAGERIENWGLKEERGTVVFRAEARRRGEVFAGPYKRSESTLSSGSCNPFSPSRLLRWPVQNLTPVSRQHSFMLNMKFNLGGETGPHSLRCSGIAILPSGLDGLRDISVRLGHFFQA